MELTASDYIFYHKRTATLRLSSWSIILDKLRRNGAAFKNIARTSNEHETDILTRRWNRNSLPHGDIFEDVTNFLMQKYANAANALVRNKFTINYNIYGCTIPERVIDTLENTVAFKIHMEWRKMAIDIKMVAGVGTPMTFKPEIMKMITAGFLDRYEFARQSNMEPDSIKNMNQNKNHLLLDVLKTALGDQNLLTRLVKGVLLVLDLEALGPQKVIGDIQSLPFTLEGLLSMYSVDNAAFVYSSVPLSSKHNFMLYQMCMSYPNQAIKTSNAHIKIPADGDVYLVLDFALDQKMEIYMTAKEAWESLITYATNMNVLPEVEKAMVIASSLSQNRYVLNASLPNVVSGANLVRPLMMPPDLTATPQPSMITMNMSKIAGRIHQMSILSSVKHVIIAAENISKDGWQKFVSMLLRNQRNQIIDVEYQNSSPDLLRNTLDFDWSSRLTSRGIYHIAKLSIFEGLWIYNNCSNHIFGKVPTHYGFCAKSLGFSSIYNTVVEELRKAGVDELGNMPKRDFKIDSPCISMETVKKVEDYFEIMDDIEEFNFGGKEKNEVTETAKKSMFKWQVLNEEKENNG